MTQKEIKVLLDEFNARLPKLPKAELEKVMKKFNIQTSTKLIRNIKIRHLRRKGVMVEDILRYKPFGFSEETSDTLIYNIAASPVYDFFEEYYKLTD